MKKDSRLYKLDEDSRYILQGLVSGFKSQIQRVEDVIDKISALSDDSFKVKIRESFVSLKYDERLERWKGICKSMFQCSFCIV